MQSHKIFRFNEVANKSSLFPSFFSSENDSERNSKVFSLPKIVRNRIPRFFSSKNGLEWNSKVFSLPRNGSERNSKGFCLLINTSERNSEGFSLPKNGLEQNSEVFLFRETGGIPTELLSVPSCSVFLGIIFFVGKWQPYSCMTYRYLM